MRHDIRLRELLSDGSTLVIQRIRRKYTCYTVPPGLLDPPIYHVREGSLDECRAAAADELAADVTEGLL